MTTAAKPVPIPVPARPVAHEMSLGKIPANAQVSVPGGGMQSILALMSRGLIDHSALSSTLMFSASTNYSG